MIIAHIDGTFAIANQQDAEALLSILSRAQAIEIAYDSEPFREVALPHHRGGAEIKIMPGKVMTDKEAEAFRAAAKRREEEREAAAKKRAEAQS